MLVPVLLYLALFAVCVVLPAVNSAPDNIEVQAGEISGQTITAPRDVVDQYTTDLLRQEAMQKIRPVYKQDETVVSGIEDKISQDFAVAETIRERAQTLYMNRMSEVTAGQPVTFDAGQVKWESFLDAAAWSDLRDIAQDVFEDEQILTIISMSQERLETLKEVTAERMRVSMEEGILSDEVESTIASIRSDMISSGTFQSKQVDVAVHILERNVEANLIFDTEATENMRQAAAAEVEEVTYQKGQNIVQKGEVVSEAQVALINELGLNNNQDTIKNRFILSFGMMAIIFVTAYLYLLLADRHLLYSIKLALNIVIMTALSVGLAMVVRNVDLRFLPAFLPIILAAAVFDTRTALAYSIFVSAVTSAMLAPVGEFLFSVQVFVAIFASTIGGWVAVLLLKKQDHRGRYVIAGTCAGIAAMAVYAVYGASQGLEWEGFLKIGVITLGSGFLCGIVSVGVLPLWESVFSLTTPAKLMELSNPGRPLLRRLMIEAPGTYHHSIMTANLAEAGCEAIHANDMLARVAAYYHDIGKLEHPAMFKENQINMPNTHDILTPTQSAQIIIAHVADGIKLAEKYKLPLPVREIIAQHHGNSLAYYFYQKECTNNPQTDEALFRYPGPKPQTREAAVVMLADMVEAAVRANGKYAPEVLHASIAKLIRGKLDDGQLDECPLTMRDLMKISEAFELVFVGAFHERIKYPEQLEEQTHERISGN